MNRTLLIALFMTTPFLFNACARRADAPKVGDVAPNFQGHDQDGGEFRLSDLIGKKMVLLYFYPKDDTPACTKEACGLRDRMGELQADNVAVVGVSHDSVASHRRFADKFHLNFTLVADPDDKIIKQYDVKMPILSIAKRVSFLIGLDGKIVHITDSMNPQVHFEEMKQTIASLKKR